LSKSEGAKSKREHQNKKKRRPTLEDFGSKKTEDCEDAKTSIDEISNKSEPVPEPTVYLDAKLQELTKTLMGAVDQKFNEFQSKMVFSDRKSLSKKKNERVLYIGDEAYQTFQKFRERPDEPLKEILKKVVRAAEKFLELTGGSKSH
jgi:hypothetical protein